MHTNCAEMLGWVCRDARVSVHVCNAECALCTALRSKRTQSANKHGETIYMRTDRTQKKVRAYAPTATMLAARLAATAAPAMVSGDVLLTDNFSMSNATQSILARGGGEVMA